MAVARPLQGISPKHCTVAVRRPKGLCRIRFSISPLVFGDGDPGFRQPPGQLPLTAKVVSLQKRR
jgi:hypothetical protein